MEGHRLLELAIDRPGFVGITGNIYLGRVEKVVPGLNAAFIGFGEENSGYLAMAEIRARDDPGGGRIAKCVSEGESVLVQVLREPSENKGAKLTTRITVAGALLVHTPGAAEVRLSRRMENEGERRRLRDCVEKLAGGSGGFVVRTAAEGAGEARLAGEAERLTTAWRQIAAAAEKAKPPACLYREAEPALRFLRDHGEPRIKRILVEGAALFNRVRAYLEQQVAASLAERLEPYRDREPLFEAWQAEEQIEAAVEDTVPLPAGGSLIIGQTPALTTVDVNTGGEGALAANLEAADEIARQLRLRNLAGLLVVDFVSMSGRKEESQVLDALRRAVASDPAGVHVGGFTRFGMVEMTRRRQGFPLARVLTSPCPACGGSGRIARPHEPERRGREGNAKR